MLQVKQNGGRTRPTAMETVRLGVAGFVLAALFIAAHPAALLA